MFQASRHRCLPNLCQSTRADDAAVQRPRPASPPLWRRIDAAAAVINLWKWKLILDSGGFWILLSLKRKRCTFSDLQARRVLIILGFVMIRTCSFPSSPSSFRGFSSHLRVGIFSFLTCVCKWWRFLLEMLELTSVVELE